MSLMKTLARVAIGVAIAKGVGAVMQGAKGGGSVAGAGRGGSFGGPSSPGAARTQTAGAAPGGLEDLMGQVLGGKARPAGQTGAPSGQADSGASGQMGGLGGLLEQLAGGATGRAPGAAGGSARSTAGAGGGLDDLLGQLAGAGGLGGLLGGLAGAAGAAPGEPADTKGGAPTGSTPATKGGAQPSFGDLLNQSLQNYGEPDTPPAPTQEATAALMLRAMIQAAKADGKVDEGERRKLLDNLGDATEAEMTFVKTELAAPVSIEGLVAQVPKGLEQQVYTMSVMAIALDNKTEAQYLHELAGGLGLDPQQVNHLHAQLGVPALYA